MIGGGERPRSTGAPVPGRVRVLYIAGLGRSGSTLVGSILGQVDGWCYGGEMKQFWKRNLVENRLCGCGVRFRECDTWRRALSEGFADAGPPEGSSVVKCLATLGRGSEPPEVFRDAVQRLYLGLHSVSGGGVIVDSSKATDYLALLVGLDGLDVRVVHLVRDPRATAHSWARRRRHPDPSEQIYMKRFCPAHTARRWVRRNREVLTLIRQTGTPCRLVTYESFTADPVGEIARIVGWTGWGDVPVQNLFGAGGVVHLAGNHGVWGNPVRFSIGEVRVRPDDEWRSRMGWWSRGVVRLRTWPSRRRYGY